MEREGQSSMDSFFYNLLFEFEWHLRKFKWFRKKKGGIWFRVIPKYPGFYESYWINCQPAINEIVLEREHY